MGSRETVGALGAAQRAVVDGAGRVEVPEAVLEWWVGADDGWHIPGTDTTTRHRRAGLAPIFETAVHVPGGDVVQRVYAAATSSADAATIIDIENATRVACSIAVVLRPRASCRRITVEDQTVTFEPPGQSTLSLSRRPRLWADGTGGEDDEVQDVVTRGGARSDTPLSWSAARDVALLVPGPPRTTFRIVHTSKGVDALTLPHAESVERAWAAQLERGLWTELPEPWQSTVDAARADVLLAPPAADVVAALEDWGFDAEAADAWNRISMRERRKARRRAAVDDPWRVLQDEAVGTAGDRDAAALLLAMRQVLAREATSTREVDVLPHFPSEWLGQPVAVHDLPTRWGPLSFAVRWHGARPALLWDAPSGSTLRAPALDPSWSTSMPKGDALLAEPPPALLAMGRRTRTEGTDLDAPDTFS